MVPSFYRFKLSWTSYDLGLITKFVYEMCFVPSFIMLYTGDFSMHHYVEVSQIRWQLLMNQLEMGQYCDASSITIFVGLPFKRHYHIESIIAF